MEVFKKHGVQISMREARLPMGKRKDLHIKEILKMPAVAAQWHLKKGKVIKVIRVNQKLALSF